MRRLLRAHPKKQVFSTPVSKFTTKSRILSANLARIRTCLDEMRQTPARPAKIGPKALSMEDLTPTKRIKREGSQSQLQPLRLPPLRGEEEQAAFRIGVFMLVASWRRRREEVRCVRKTLEFQVSCSERLRVQVCALKALLDSDNAKVRLAMRELHRLKLLLRDKDLEKAVLEKEKLALEQDICAAEDRASEMSIGWRNCRNELESARAATAAAQAAMAEEHAARVAALERCQLSEERIGSLEARVSERETRLARVAEDAASLRREVAVAKRALSAMRAELRREMEARSRAEHECRELSSRVAQSAQECLALSARVEELSAQVERERRRWWPAPLSRVLCLARAWLLPRSLPDAALWVLVPARHGC